MRQVVTYVYCDVCANIKGEDPEYAKAVSTMVFGLADEAGDWDVANIKVTRVLELCEQHTKELNKFLSVSRLITSLTDTRFQLTKTAQISKSMLYPKTTGPIDKQVPCPVCHNPYTKGPGLALHCKRHHPEIDRGTLREYTMSVMLNRSMREEQEQ